MPRKTKIVAVPVESVEAVEEVKAIENVETVEVVEPVVEQLPSTPETFNTITITEQPEVSNLKGKCDMCGKTMLFKNLKYAHPKICKNRPRPPTPVAPPVLAPSINVDKVVVNVDGKNHEIFSKSSNSLNSSSITISSDNVSKSNVRVDLRKQRIKHLLDNAF